MGYTLHVCGAAIYSGKYYTIHIWEDRERALISVAAITHKKQEEVNPLIRKYTYTFRISALFDALHYGPSYRNVRVLMH